MPRLDALPTAARLRTVLPPTAAPGPPVGGPPARRAGGPEPPRRPAGEPRLPWVPGSPADDETRPILLAGAAGSAPPAAEPVDPTTEPLLVLAPRPGPAARLRRLAPAGWRGARLDPGRRGALLLAVVAAVAAAVAALGVWTDRPRAEPVTALPAVAVDEPAAGPTAEADGTPAPGGGPLVVSVSGAVARPGLVEVPAGARVADVLTAAGGALPGTDLTALNLARRVADGEQVAVGVPPAPDAAGPAAGAGPAAPAGPVDLNTAGVAQLDALPGVGPVTAQRIVEWRTRNGRFSRVEQLREIEGIGERRFAQLRELVTV